ncbi:hypothetical protein ABIE88_004521 [Bradyrhizobium diazoefficiens]
MSSATPQRPNGLALFILPSALLFALFFFLPIGLMALMSVLTGNPVVAPKVAFTTRHYARMIDDPFYLEVIWTTIRIGLVTTLVALAIGYPLAHWMARIKSRTGHALLLMAVLAPMLTGIVVRTFAWMTLLSDKGVVNQTLMSLGVISQPLKLMYTETGIVVGLVHIYVPFMVLTLTGVIGRIDERLEQAGGKPRREPLACVPRGDAAAQPARHPRRLAAGVCAGDQRLCHADPARRLPDHDAADPDLPADLGELQRRLRRRARHHPADDLARARRRL